VNRIWYPILCVFEVIAIVIVIGLLALPIQDYAMREFKEWMRHPSAETRRAFREKQQEEPRARLAIGAPFAVAALLLAIPLFRSGRKSKGQPQ